MKKIFSNKKIILIILIIILAIIFSSNYLKTENIRLPDYFNKQEKIETEQFYEDEAKTTAQDQKALAAVNNKEDKIESIALISQIKDPFKQKESEKKENKKNNIAKDEFLNEDFNQDLLFLEENIIADKLQLSDNKDLKNHNQKKEVKSDKNNKVNEGNKELDLNIKLPFKLMGIVKNKNNSAALFLYQGKNILKKENEKIDLFQIKEINNKNIILTYQNKIRVIKLWEDQNEN